MNSAVRALQKHPSDRKAVVIVIDGVGVGELPDAELYRDSGANSIRNAAMAAGGVVLPNLQRMGLGHVCEARGLSREKHPEASFGRMAMLSAGKDSTTGHWELMGVILENPFPLYPEGFPAEVIEAFERRIGRRILGNRAASGTEIIEKLGEEHMRTGFPIVYTSADSVFQIAAHEAVIPRRELYAMCRAARKILVPPYHVSRVIARPFTGIPGSFVRTSGRRDFSLPPPGKTLLDALSERNRFVVTVGKIHDLFAKRGISRILKASSNDASMRAAERIVKSGEPFSLLFVNLIEFDMTWGHRRDAGGYIRGLERFDTWLGRFAKLLPQEVLLVVTSDHGCDPTMPGSDHTREYVPLIALIKGREHGESLGTRETLADLAATLAEWFEIPFESGKSFLSRII